MRDMSPHNVSQFRKHAEIVLNAVKRKQMGATSCRRARLLDAMGSRSRHQEVIMFERVQAYPEHMIEDRNRMITASTLNSVTCENQVWR